MSADSKFKLLTAFRNIGQQINLSSFNKRLIFQKQVYLLQELGLRLGYSFGWYIHGPYSREAASDGFQLVTIQNEIENPPELTESESRATELLQELIVESVERFGTGDNAYSMELLGSLHFVLKHGYPKPTSEEEAITKFNTLKPGFIENTNNALELLKEKNLA